MSTSGSEVSDATKTRRQRPPRWRAIALLLVVFVVGVASGLGGGALVLRAGVRAVIAAPGGGSLPVDRLMTQLGRRIAFELSLTSDERAAVREELSVAAAEFKRLRAAFGDGAQLTIRDTLSRIERRLPPEKGERLRARAQQRLAPWGIEIADGDKP